MAELNLEDIVAPQREVQRLLGRCLIRIQQYEHQLKLILASQEVSGSAKTMLQRQNTRVAETSDKSLGILIGRLLGSYIAVEGSESPDLDVDLAGESCYLQTRMHLHLPQDSYETLKGELRELVSLRNTLVHHFIEHHDVWTLAGCLNARDSLLRAYDEIDRHFERLRSYAGHMDEARQKLVEVMKSPQFLDLLRDGIDLDGKVHWPIAGIVSALREALREVAVDGWANLEAAARWVSKNQPEQTPQKYGCSRWRHVVHASGQFEIRRMTHHGQTGAWYRERPTRGQDVEVEIRL